MDYDFASFLLFDFMLVFVIKHIFWLSFSGDKSTIFGIDPDP